MTDLSILTRQERKHLRDNGVTDAGELEVLLRWQADRRDEGGREPCWECFAIARKLGVPTRSAERSRFIPIPPVIEEDADGN